MLLVVNPVGIERRGGCKQCSIEHSEAGCMFGTTPVHNGPRAGYHTQRWVLILEPVNSSHQAGKHRADWPNWRDTAGCGTPSTWHRV